MKIYMIAHFSDGIGENTNNRFNYLFELLKNEHEVTFITSSFSHRDKIQRKKSTNDNIIYLYEPSYSKNVSFKRLFSHFVFSKSVKKYLRNADKPDMIYCAIPSLSVGKTTKEFCLKNSIDFVIDVQDLWPKAFKLILGRSKIINLLFKPLEEIEKSIYEAANAVIAVSNTYLDHVVQYSNLSKYNVVTYLGTSSIMDDASIAQNRSKNEIKVAYVGTIGHSYDLGIVIEALKLLKEDKDLDVSFEVFGDGPHFDKYITMAKAYSIKHNFYGRLSYDEMIKKVRTCNIAVNPIKSGAAQSITNKHADYSANWLPIINTQECNEYCNLIEKYNMGWNVLDKNPKTLARAIKELSMNHDARYKMSENSFRFANDFMDREKTYPEIKKILENLHYGDKISKK